MPATKIVATLGPATRSEDRIRELIRAGVDVFRINSSHAKPGEIPEWVRMVRKVSEELGAMIGILLDLQGPKIRLGTFENGGCELEKGSSFTITTKELVGNCERASTVYADFAKDVKPGDRVLLADGSIELLARANDGVAVECQVLSGGPISDKKGINLPGVRVSTPSLTKKDVADLREALTVGIDFVAISFVRCREDVLRLRHFLEQEEVSIPIVSKIEKPEAWQNLDAILQESDGVMVARGDLGVEMALEKVPAIQKAIIQRARQHGKFVITATQMLESMIQNSFPTRAEVSDVANAIYDGTDAVMLSAETSMGKNPIGTVQMMDKIITEAESAIRQKGFASAPTSVQELSQPQIIAQLAYEAAEMAKAVAIAVFSASGATGRLVSTFRSPVPVYVFTHSPDVARQLSINYGVRAVVVAPLESTDAMLAQVDRMLGERRSLNVRDCVIFVAGQPIGRKGTTNLLKLHRIGELR